jgi:hypothetical protein
VSRTEVDYEIAILHQLPSTSKKPITTGGSHRSLLEPRTIRRHSSPQQVVDPTKSNSSPPFHLSAVLSSSPPSPELRYYFKPIQTQSISPTAPDFSRPHAFTAIWNDPFD